MGGLRVDMEVLDGMSPRALMDGLGLPHREVGLLLVNGKLVKTE